VVTTVNHYAALLELARRQADLLDRGDLGSAVALLDERQQLLDAVRGATTANAAEVQAMLEVLRLDRALSNAIRRRMIDLRDEAAGLSRSRVAMAGYAPPAAAGRRASQINALG
jgi:hypothetical protein